MQELLVSWNWHSDFIVMLIIFMKHLIIFLSSASRHHLNQLNLWGFCVLWKALFYFHRLMKTQIKISVRDQHIHNDAVHFNITSSCLFLQHVQFYPQFALEAGKLPNSEEECRFSVLVTFDGHVCGCRVWTFGSHRCPLTTAFKEVHFKGADNLQQQE